MCYAMSRLEEEIKNRNLMLKRTVNFYKSIETESKT